MSGYIQGCSDMWSSPQCSDRLSGLDSCVCWYHTHSCLQYSTSMYASLNPKDPLTPNWTHLPWLLTNILICITETWFTLEGKRMVGLYNNILSYNFSSLNVFLLWSPFSKLTKISSLYIFFRMIFHLKVYQFFESLEFCKTVQNPQLRTPTATFLCILFT